MLYLYARLFAHICCLYDLGFGIGLRYICVLCVCYVIVMCYQYTTTKFKDQDGRILPFVITDVMGLESERDRGVQPEDIISALKGHIKEDYTVRLYLHEDTDSLPNK